MGSDDRAADHQAAWALGPMVEKFSTKTASDFFRSEIHYVPRIRSARSVLDVGCASGRLIELLAQHLEPEFTFTGVDLVAQSIDRARAAYPEHSFHLGDFLDLDLPGPFDFANATGVVQHEPRYREVIAKMVANTTGWVLFDAKTAPIDADLVDRERSSVVIEDTRLYFNVLAHYPLVDWLRRLDRVAAVSVFGYPATPNARTTVPDDLGPFAAVGIFLTIDPDATSIGPAPVDAEVPAFLAQ